MAYNPKRTVARMLLISRSRGDAGSSLPLGKIREAMLQSRVESRWESIFEDNTTSSHSGGAIQGSRQSGVSVVNSYLNEESSDQFRKGIRMRSGMNPTTVPDIDVYFGWPVRSEGQVRLRLARIGFVYWRGVLKNFFNAAWTSLACGSAAIALSRSMNCSRTAESVSASRSMVAASTHGLSSARQERINSTSSGASRSTFRSAPTAWVVTILSALCWTIFKTLRRIERSDGKFVIKKGTTARSLNVSVSSSRFETSIAAAVFDGFGGFVVDNNHKTAQRW